MLRRRRRRSDFFLDFAYLGHFCRKSIQVRRRRLFLSLKIRRAQRADFFWFFKGWEGEKGVFLGPKAKLSSARSAENSARAARRFFFGFLKGGRVRREFFLVQRQN